MGDESLVRRGYEQEVLPPKKGEESGSPLDGTVLDLTEHLGDIAEHPPKASDVLDAYKKGEDPEGEDRRRGTIIDKEV